MFLYGGWEMGSNAKVKNPHGATAALRATFPGPKNKKLKAARCGFEFS